MVEAEVTAPWRPRTTPMGVASPGQPPERSWVPGKGSKDGWQAKSFWGGVCWEGRVQSQGDWLVSLGCISSRIIITNSLNNNESVIVGQCKLWWAEECRAKYQDLNSQQNESTLLFAWVRVNEKLGFRRCSRAGGTGKNLSQPLLAYRATQNADNEMQPFLHTSSESLLNHQETEGSGI